MKLLFDENLSHHLVGELQASFPGSAHIRGIGMKASTDSDIWKFAAGNGFIIVSKDVDFQQRAFLYGAPPKVIWIRLGNCNTKTIADLLRARAADILSFDADPQSSFLVLSK